MPLPATFMLSGRSGNHTDRSIHVKIQNPKRLTKLDFLEWLFKITNAPAECLNETDKVTLEVNKEVLQGNLWCISVGDCFNFEEATSFCCYPIGWTEVPVGNLWAYFGKGGERAGVLPAPIGKKGLVNRFDTDKSV